MREQKEKADNNIKITVLKMQAIRLTILKLG